MITFFVTLATMLVILLLISVRILLKRDGEFHGTCSSNNPHAGKSGVNGCVCGRRPGEECPNADDPDHEPDEGCENHPAHAHS